MTDPTRRPDPNAGKSPPQRPAPAKPAGQPARPAPAAAPQRPAAAQPQRAPAPAQRVRAAAPVQEEEPAPARRSAVRREAPPEEQLDPTTKKGLIAAGVMLLIGASIWIVIHNKHVKEDDEIRATQMKRDGFLADVNKVVKDETAPDEAIQAILQRIETEKDKWEPFSTSGDVVAGRAKLVARLDTRKADREWIAQFKEASQHVENAANVSSEQLSKDKQTLNDLMAGAGSRGPEYEQKIKEMLNKIDHLVVAKAPQEARDFVALPATTAHQGLAKYAAAEDLVRQALESANKVQNKVDSASYTETYKTLLKESDEYSAKVITPEFIESISWKDLLNGEMAARWSKVKNVPGFSFRLENGILQMSPPDAGSGQQGVAGILDQLQDNTRHLVLDMEFSLEGVATMYFHVSPPPNPPNNLQSEAYDINATDRGVFRPNQKYTMYATYIGTQLSITYPNDMDLQRYEPLPNWAKRRRGGIAFLIPEGCRVKVTRMRIKELR